MGNKSSPAEKAKWAANKATPRSAPAGRYVYASTPRPEAHVPRRERSKFRGIVTGMTYHRKVKP